MNIFDGKYHAAKLDKYISDKISTIDLAGEFLIVLVGDNPVSLHYINIKKRLLESFGIKVRFLNLSTTLEDAEIITKIGAEFEDDQIKGGLIQIPLPRITLNKVLDLIPPHKDLDFISSTNVARFNAGDFNYMTPVVRAFNYFALTALMGEAQNVSDYLDKITSTQLLQEKLSGLDVTILGQGDLVGSPISKYLNNINVNPSTSINYTKGDKIYSNLLVLGAGVPRLVAGENISAGCHVIDYGITVINDKVVGDLDKLSQLDHLGTVAFSPGGIGSVVVRCLLLNFLGL